MSDWHEWTGNRHDDLASGVPVAVRWYSGNEWVGLSSDFSWWHTGDVLHEWDIQAYRFIPIERNYRTTENEKGQPGGNFRLTLDGARISPHE